MRVSRKEQVLKKIVAKSVQPVVVPYMLTVSGTYAYPIRVNTPTDFLILSSG